MKKWILVAAIAAVLPGCTASEQERTAWKRKTNMQVIECAAESQNVKAGDGALLSAAAINGRRYDACFNEFNLRANSGAITQQEYAMYIAMTRQVNVNVQHSW